VRPPHAPSAILPQPSLMSLCRPALSHTIPRGPLLASVFPSHCVPPPSPREPLSSIPLQPFLSLSLSLRSISQPPLCGPAPRPPPFPFARRLPFSPPLPLLIPPFHPSSSPPPPRPPPPCLPIIPLPVSSQPSPGRRPRPPRSCPLSPYSFHSLRHLGTSALAPPVPFDAPGYSPIGASPLPLPPLVSFPLYSLSFALQLTRPASFSPCSECPRPARAIFPPPPVPLLDLPLLPLHPHCHNMLLAPRLPLHIFRLAPSALPSSPPLPRLVSLRPPLLPTFFTLLLFLLMPPALSPLEPVFCFLLLMFRGFCLEGSF